MALLIERYLKQGGVPYKETLLFAYPLEVGMEEDDHRLITLEESEEKVFWYQGFNFRTVEKDFFRDDVPPEEKQWDPYKHQLEEGVELSSFEEYTTYVASQQQKLIDVYAHIEGIEAEKKARKRAVLANLGLTEEQLDILINS